MKRLFVATMCVVLLCAQSHAGFLKAVSGMVLMAAGSFAAIDGFKEVVDDEWDEPIIIGTNKIDISNPQVDYSNWAWTSEKIISWWADAAGTMTNTGNVDLKNVMVNVTFFDTLYTPIETNSTFVNSTNLGISVGSTISWDRYYNNCGSSYPVLAGITVTYDYDPIYETQSIYGIVHRTTYKKKNELQGYAGIAAGAGGLYLIIDSVLDNSRIKKAMKKRDLDIQFAQKPNYFGLRLTKRL